MSDLFREINLWQIDLGDDRYKLPRSEEDITFLAQSIQQEGLVVPPIVRLVTDRFVILSGFNRIKALLQNKEKKAWVYQVDPATGDYHCLVKSIAAISFQRSLTQAELIICVKRLYQFLSPEEIAQRSPAVFNTKLTGRFVEDLLTIGALPDPCLELVRKGCLSLKSALRLSSYQNEIIDYFLTVFSHIKASSSSQLEIIQFITEITARDSVKMDKFLETKEFADILYDPDTDPGSKTKNLRTWLFKQRFPTIFKTRQRVQDKIASIKLGRQIKLLPPQNFESQHYSISFTVKNYKAFEDTVQSLKNALENKDLKEILTP